jgi:hypothetical protein
MVMTPNAAIGDYTVSSAPEMPDYLKQPLPPTTASGKITIDEKAFTITEGTIKIPDWHAAGAYRVEEIFAGGNAGENNGGFGIARAGAH